MATVNARSFNGTSDVIRVASPAFFGGGAYTWAAVLKRSGTGAYAAPLSIGGAGTATPNVVLEFTSADAFEVVHDSNHEAQETYAWGTTNLILVAVTRTGSAGNMRFHVFESGVWTHVALTSGSGANPSDWTGLADDELRFGNWNASFNYFAGLMVVQALADVGLDDSAVEGLAGGDSASWQAAGFDHLWEFDQASSATDVTDAIGSLDQIGITGTGVTTVDLPGTVYVLGGGGGGGGSVSVRVDGEWVAGTRQTRVDGAWA